MFYNVLVVLLDVSSRDLVTLLLVNERTELATLSTLLTQNRYWLHALPGIATDSSVKFPDTIARTTSCVQELTVSFFQIITVLDVPSVLCKTILQRRLLNVQRNRDITNINTNVITNISQGLEQSCATFGATDVESVFYDKPVSSTLSTL